MLVTCIEDIFKHDLSQLSLNEDGSSLNELPLYKTILEKVSRGDKFYDKKYFNALVNASIDRGYISDREPESVAKVLLAFAMTKPFTLDGNIENVAGVDYQHFTFVASKLINNTFRKEESGTVITLDPSKIKDYTNHSGGAYGGDTYWDIIGREFGVIEHRHYRESSNANLSKQLRDRGVKAILLSEEEMEKARTEIKTLLGEEYPDNVAGNLKTRNYYQVANSDGVFAIAKLNRGNMSVKGGTDVAVQLGIKLNKPTYVWDVNTQQWHLFNKQSGRFEVTDTPVLTKNFAGVGTRDIENYDVKNKTTGEFEPRKEYVGLEIENKAKQAIRDVYTKTFGQSEQTNDSKLTNTVYEALGFNNTITPNDRIVFGHPTIGKSFLKNQGEDKFISLDDDYATEINNKVKEIAEKYSITTYQVKDGGTQEWNKEYNKMMQEMFDVAKQRAFSENKTLFTSNTNLLRNNAKSFDKVINLTTEEFERRIRERGAKYDIKEWKSQINEAVSKIPANKVINTDKYLSDLFLTPKQKQQALEYVVNTQPQTDKIKTLANIINSKQGNITLEANDDYSEDDIAKAVMQAKPEYRENVILPKNLEKTVNRKTIVENKKVFHYRVKHVVRHGSKFVRINKDNLVPVSSEKYRTKYKITNMKAITEEEALSNMYGGISTKMKDGVEEKNYYAHRVDKSIKNIITRDSPRYIEENIKNSDIVIFVKGNSFSDNMLQNIQRIQTSLAKTDNHQTELFVIDAQLLNDSDYYKDKIEELRFIIMNAQVADSRMYITGSGVPFPQDEKYPDKSKYYNEYEKLISDFISDVLDNGVVREGC